MYNGNEEMLKQSVTVTTRCPLVIKNWARQNNVKIPRILWAGYESMTRKKPDEIQALNTKVGVLAEKLMRTQKKLWELEGEMGVKEDVSDTK